MSVAGKRNKANLDNTPLQEISTEFTTLSGSDSATFWSDNASITGNIFKLRQDNTDILTVKKADGNWVTKLTDGYLEAKQVTAPGITATTSLKSPYANVTQTLVLGAATANLLNAATVTFNDRNIIKLDFNSQIFGSTKETTLQSTDNNT